MNKTLLLLRKDTKFLHTFFHKKCGPLSSRQQIVPKKIQNHVKLVLVHTASGVTTSVVTPAQVRAIVEALGEP